MPADAQVARTVSLDDILERTFPKDIIRLEDRSGVAGGAAGASSVASGVIAASTFKKIILKKITTKVATKSVFKLAAKALMKPLASLGLKVSAGATGGAVYRRRHRLNCPLCWNRYWCNGRRSFGGLDCGCRG